MYEIRCKSPDEARKVCEALEQKLAESRFYLCGGLVIRMYKGLNRVIQLRGVRLHAKKHYCGNHAYDCQLVNPGRDESRRKRMAYLEGRDWVAFNDMVNDVLDRLRISAYVGSSLVTVRTGDKRCVEYFADLDFGGEWKRLGRYESWCGRRAPRSKFPEGTPGRRGWRMPGLNRTKHEPESVKQDLGAGPG